MRSKLKKFAIGGAVAAATAAGVSVLTPGAAKAAPTASYNGVCGSGYSVIDQLPLTGATVFLTYNGSIGRNCVVTIRNTPGVALPMDAEVSLHSSSTWISDSGNYTTYAGPVYVTAAHQCIDWAGGFNHDYVQELDSHCG